MKKSNQRDTFIFYRSFKESMKDLSAEDKLIMYEAISDYSLDLKEPELSGFPKALFSLIKPILDANIKRWRNGCKGGAPEGNKNNRFSKNTTEVQPEANQNTTEVQANKDKDKDVDKEYKLEINNRLPISPKGENILKFIKPSIEEVRKYCQERKNNIDAEAFVNFYESKGWMIGKNKMKDWRASMRTWERSQKSQPRNSEDIGIVLKNNTTSKYDNDKPW
jgi:hypothetical protein